MEGESWDSGVATIGPAGGIDDFDSLWLHDHAFLSFSVIIGIFVVWNIYSRSQCEPHRPSDDGPLQEPYGRAFTGYTYVPA